MAYAQQAINSGPLISVWSPAVSSGNITDPNLLPGDTFSLSVNITKDSSPGFHDTSSFMIGKIAVGIILPNGPLYNWTDAQVNQSISGIKAAMNFWASQDPGANLTFYFDTHIRVPTSYEPTKLP